MNKTIRHSFRHKPYNYLVLFKIYINIPCKSYNIGRRSLNKTGSGKKNCKNNSASIRDSNFTVTLCELTLNTFNK